MIFLYPAGVVMTEEAKNSWLVKRLIFVTIIPHFRDYYFSGSEVNVVNFN